MHKCIGQTERQLSCYSRNNILDFIMDFLKQVQVIISYLKKTKLNFQKSSGKNLDYTILVVSEKKWAAAKFTLHVYLTKPDILDDISFW